MLKAIKNQLIDNINTANLNNELTAQKMYTFSYENVIQFTNVFGDETNSLHTITKDILILSVQTLVKANISCPEKIFATLQGIVDGVKQVELRRLNNIQNEFIQVKKPLIKEDKIFVNSLSIALGGAQEASESFTGSIRANIEAALADTKLKNTELLGLTKDTVKQAIFSAIETSTQLENDIITITYCATTKALAESYFNIERISTVTENVLLAAVEAAEEADIHVILTASAATDGVHQGLRKSITKIGSGLSLIGDLEQILKGLESVGNLFTETLYKVADKSDKPAKGILQDLAHDSQKAGSTLREKAVLVTQAIANRIDE